MNFSSKSVYAIQLLVDMAVYGDYGNVKVRDISERQGVSAKYLEGIVSVLGKAGIVKGERGPQGGYRLGMSSRNITVGMVVRAIEGISHRLPSADRAVIGWRYACPRAYGIR